MRTVLLALTTGLLLIGVAAPSHAEDSSGVATAPVIADAWYAVSPTCGAPVGCAPVPGTSSQPAKTLHVGTAVTGAEDARSYLRLDLGALPAGAVVTGGTLTLPVAPAADGTRNETVAALQVCVVAEAFDPSAEGAANPPAVDCTVAAPARYDAAGDRFSADLASLAGVLRGAAAKGLAVVAAPGSPADWHVAFSSAERTGAVAPPSAQLAFRLPTTPSVVAKRPAITRDRTALTRPLPRTANASVLAAGVAAPVAPARPQTTTPTQPPVAPPSAEPAPVEPLPADPALDVATPFAYPSVFLVPIALVAGAGWAARAFTRELDVPA